MTRASFGLSVGAADVSSSNSPQAFQAALPNSISNSSTAVGSGCSGPSRLDFALLEAQAERLLQHGIAASKGFITLEKQLTCLSADD